MYSPGTRLRRAAVTRLRLELRCRDSMPGADPSFALISTRLLEKREQEPVDKRGMLGQSDVIGGDELNTVPANRGPRARLPVASRAFVHQCARTCHRAIARGRFANAQSSRARVNGKH